MSSANALGLHQPLEIARSFRQNGVLPNVRLPRIGTHRLWRILSPHRSYEHCSALLQLVASEPWMYPSIMDRIVCESSDFGVLNSVACSPRVQLTTLRRLSSSNLADSVRQHAAIGIYSRQFARMSSVDILKLLRKHSGDEGSSLGIRALIARSRHTPNEVLELILVDDVDFVREAAASEVRRRTEQG